MIFLSSNAYSVDDQTADAISHLSTTAPPLMEQFVKGFPEYNRLVWCGSWVDPKESGVDEDYMCWVRDWIEQHTTVTWWDGEPVIFEPGDEVE